MNKSGERFDEVISQVRTTNAARLSVKYAALRNAVVHSKVEELKGQVIQASRDATLASMDPVWFSAESPFNEAQEGLRSSMEGRC